MKTTKVSYNRLGSVWILLATQTNLCQFVSREDVKVFRARLDGEGLPFLTTVLPELGKSLHRTLKYERLDPNSRFKNVKGKAYPLFLSGAWSKILTDDGLLLPEPNADAVRCIRQLTLMFYKLKLGYTPEQEKSVADAFVQIDASLVDFSLDIVPQGMFHAFEDPNVAMLRRARSAVRKLLRRFPAECKKPRHGSGSSACGIKPHHRYGTYRFIPRLDAVVPYRLHMFYNENHAALHYARWYENRVECEPAAKVVLVEKDSRGPRLISAEPREFMYAQQGYRAQLHRACQQNEAISTQLDCEDQSRNQDAARAASIERMQASIDLSEASDRVSWNMVCYLFPEDWVAAFAATRSLHTVLPDGRRVVFNKFAPMGSALCFPVEAICFWALTHAAVNDGGFFLNRTMNDTTLPDDPVIRVFGDDIICETEMVSDVIHNLEYVGLKVNTDKSYTVGPFRESCGGDYLDGVDVGIVRANNLLGDCLGSDRTPMFRMIDLINNLVQQYGFGTFGKGLLRLARKSYPDIPICTDANWEKLLPSGKRVCAWEHEGWLPFYSSRLGFPFIQPHNGCVIVAPESDVPGNVQSRWNPSLQRLEFRLWTERAVEHKLSGHGWCQLFRSTLQGSEERTSLFYAVPKRVTSTLGWVEIDV
jgi:hypothetical protein